LKREKTRCGKGVVALIKGLVKWWEGMKTGDKAGEDVRGRKGWRKKEEKGRVM
jgi:hypothetical protein